MIRDEFYPHLDLSVEAYKITLNKTVCEVMNCTIDQDTRRLVLFQPILACPFLLVRPSSSDFG